MKSLHRSRHGFTLIELLVVIAIIAILAALAVPQITGALVRGQLTQTVNNGRQIYLATFNMANDSAVNQDPNLGWPGDLAASTTNPVQSLVQFTDRLVTYDYVKKADLGKIFAAPGVPPYTGNGQFGATNSAFKIYKVTESDVSNVIFTATKNFNFDSGLDENTAPYKSKGFVIVRKGGDALSLGKQQALDKRLVGLMPGKNSQDDPGSEGGNILTME